MAKDTPILSPEAMAIYGLIDAEEYITLSQKELEKTRFNEKERKGISERLKEFHKRKSKLRRKSS